MKKVILVALSTIVMASSVSAGIQDLNAPRTTLTLFTKFKSIDGNGPFNKKQWFYDSYGECLSGLSNIAEWKHDDTFREWVSQPNDKPVVTITDNLDGTKSDYIGFATCGSITFKY